MTGVVDAISGAKLRQAAASDPGLNAFVSANAGSGKTKVLVDRVVRLLLAGAPPSKILCLTYTKAAASEMQSRLFKQLGDWSVADDAHLRGALEDLAPERGGDAPTALREARALFARALETPGGLKVQTIHAFCERLLRRFPVEAGVEPGFDVLDDMEANRLIARARAAVGREGLDGGRLSDAFATLAAVVSDREVDGVLDWAAGKRVALRGWLASIGGAEAGRRALAASFGLEANATALDEKARAWAEAPKAELRRAAEILSLGKSTDQGFAARIASALAAAAPDEAFDAYAEGVFTKNAEPGAGPPRKSFATKDLAAAHPLLAELFGSEKDGYGREIERMITARERVRQAQILELSGAGLAVADAYIRAYEAEKRRIGAVDFADLIGAAGQLLSVSEAADWVLYKLDGGVEHVLVDEAQDTAPDQWDLINALTAEFFAGAGAREAARTAFAVGDEKQSIYSFQGADPTRFLDESRALEARVRAAGQTFKAPSMDVSFRSAPAILQLVDEVLADPDVTDRMLAGRTPPTVDLGHAAARRDMEGCVELWPLMEAEEGPEPSDDWSAPVDATPSDHPRELVARAVAETIRDWIAAGEAVGAKTPEGGGARALRAMRPGDVMVLVRKRGELFERIIRRLKAAGVPVAGADRMTLPAQLAVEDVLGLARVALLPEDDLALAELLKSPFLDPADKRAPLINEEALFDLAHGREGRLIAALRASTDKRFAEARALVERLISAARNDGPYAFLAGVLDSASATGESYARRLYARLGPEAEDPVKELLSRALAHERRGAPSLERFVSETMADAAQVKRETAAPRDEVRVMTVHAAKGLEAPVVILPDAGDKRGGAGDSAPFFDAERGLIWSPRKRDEPADIAPQREARAEAAAAEDLRLFYVALTRACDRLVICGAAPGRGSGGSTWHSLAEAGLKRADAGPIETPGGAGLRLGAPPAPVRADKARKDKPAVLPRWIDAQVRADGDGRRLRSPAAGLSGGGAGLAALSPLAEGGADRFRRGVLIHTLLQTLPELDRNRRAQVAADYLTGEGVAGDQAEALIGETLSVLDDPQFAEIFGPGSRAEVAVAGAAAGLPAGYVANGRIDRLVVTKDAVLIVDFKTNRPPPQRVEDVAALYMEQMAIYRAVMRALHPGKTVRAALVWTDGPALMALPDSLLDAALDAGLIGGEVLHN